MKPDKNSLLHLEELMLAGVYTKTQNFLKVLVNEAAQGKPESLN